MADATPPKPKRAVTQKTLDMLAAGRAKLDAARAAKKAAKAAAPKANDAPVVKETPPAATAKPDEKPPRPERCHKCWARPCVCVKRS